MFPLASFHPDSAVVRGPTLPLGAAGLLVTIRAVTTSTASVPDPQPGGLPSLREAASLVRLHIVAIACLATFVYGWAFTGVWSPWPLVLSAIDWFVINLLNRVVDVEEDALNGVPGTDFAARHPSAILWGCLLLLGGSLIASHLLLPALTWLRVACHVIGFPYNFRMLPGKRRLKELYFFKNSGSAAIFLITVFGYPLAASGWAAGFLPDVTWATVAVCAGFFVLFELSYEVIYDLRDAPGDRAANVRTYPVVHGEAVAVRIVDGLIVVPSLILIAGYGAGVVPWRLVVMVLAAALQLGLYKRALRRGLTKADCIGLTWLGAAQLFAYCIWVAVGLPLDLLA